MSLVVGGLAMIADDDLSCCLIDEQDDKIEETVTSDGDTSCNSLSVVILNFQEERENVDESSSLSLTDWSMLSEVSSVVTFETSMVLSFKDAWISNAEEFPRVPMVQTNGLATV
jgi:hypothetical protein